MGLFLGDFFKFLSENWDDLEEIADDTVCGDFKDGCFGVFVDSEDVF